MKNIFSGAVVFIVFFIISCSKKTGDDPSTPLTNLQDIQYGLAPDSAGIQTPLLMDIYFPAGATTTDRYPLVVMIHGGGFVQGNKDDVKTHCRILADSGFVAVTISYRLGWRNGTGNCDGDTSSKRLAGYRAIQDANAAFRFLVSKANDYAIDVNSIFIGGASAGAGTSLLTTYITNTVAQQIATTEYAALGPVNNSGNSLTHSFRIKGIANLWGALPDSNLLTISTALPMISFHGTADNVVPYDYGYSNNCPQYALEFGSACLTRRLQAAGKPYWLRLKAGGGHGPDLYVPTFTMPKVATFFKKLIRGENIENKVWID